MNGKKTLILSVICSLLIMAPAYVMSCSETFSDTKGHWAESYINEAVKKGFVLGYPDNTFRPGNPVTRAEFTAMLNKALGNEAAVNIAFKDVPTKKWFRQDVEKAVAAAYATGYDDDTFRPDSLISRQEAAVMISKVITKNESPGNLDVFPDSKSVSGWANAAFREVIGKKYMSEYNVGNLHP
jgi:hypothetical protein